MPEPDHDSARTQIGVQMMQATVENTIIKSLSVSKTPPSENTKRWARNVAGQILIALAENGVEFHVVKLED